MLKKKKNKITVLLLSVTICLWGVILYNIIAYYTSMDNVEEDIVITSEDALIVPAKKNTTIDDGVFYKEIGRDPFVFRIKETEEYVEESPVTFTPPPKPQYLYHFTGTIINGNRKLVIFQDDSNNNTHFLREGQSFNGIKIVSIAIDKVKVIEDSKEKEVPVRP